MSKSKAGSVAPKERINIQYKPNDNDGREKAELPFRMLVTGNFTGREDDAPVEERELISINQKNFGSVMQKMGVESNFVTKNTISGKDDEALDVSLKFSSIKSFTPDAVAEQVPEIQKLLKVRESLVALKGPVGNLPNLRKVIQNKLNEVESRDNLTNVLKLEKKSDDSEDV